MCESSGKLSKLPSLKFAFKPICAPRASDHMFPCAKCKALLE